jgi:hypothetical protein
LVTLVLVGAAGCSRPAGETAAPATAAPTTAAAPSTTPVPARTTKPKPAPAPATVDAPCPYADSATIAETVGQHIARSTVTRTRPHVGCAFYRPNGEQAADIAVSVLADPLAAQTRALAVAGQAANPVDGVGDGGAVTITATGAVLGVSKGRALVVVRINQRISLEAVEIAKLVVATL